MQWREIIPVWRKPLRRNVHMFIAISALAGCTCNLPNGCSISDDKRLELSVLVDLSGSWHDPDNVDVSKRNRVILETLGRSISDAIQEYHPPVTVTYFGIGKYSRGQEPLCKVVYEPKIFSFRNPSNSYATKKNTLYKYLSEECPFKIIHLEKQPYTDITGALLDQKLLLTERSDAQRRQMKKKTVPKIIILLSDMVETQSTVGDTPKLEDADFTGFSIFMIYRKNPNSVSGVNINSRNHNSSHITEWEVQLQNRGAEIQKLDDRQMNSRTITYYLQNR